MIGETIIGGLIFGAIESALGSGGSKSSKSNYEDKRRREEQDRKDRERREREAFELKKRIDKANKDAIASAYKH